jgi:hypothetical protein
MRALDVCDGNIDVAFEYLKLRSQPLVRKKLTADGYAPWDTEDYVNAAKLAVNKE